MANEKRLIAIGDVLFIIAKYMFTMDEKPKVVEVQVLYRTRKKFTAYPTNGYGAFCFSNGDLGKTVFFDRADAQAELESIINKYYRGNGNV